MKIDFFDLYGSVARNYLARPGYPKELFQWLAQQAPGLDVAWDCGCGSGQASHDLAKYFSKVVATDASPEQIKQALPGARISFKCAPAESSGLPTSSADLISVFMAVHWFDLDAFYSEVYRIAKPGAVIAVFVYGEPFVADVAVNQALANISDLIAPYGGPSIQKMRNRYVDLHFPFEDELSMPELQMEAHMTKEELLDYTRSRASVIDYTKQHGPAAVHALAQALEQLADPGLRLEVKWPLHGRIAKISKPANLAGINQEALSDEPDLLLP